MNMYKYAMNVHECAQICSKYEMNMHKICNDMQEYAIVYAKKLHIHILVSEYQEQLEELVMCCLLCQRSWVQIQPGQVAYFAYFAYFSIFCMCIKFSLYASTNHYEYIPSVQSKLICAMVQW